MGRPARYGCSVCKKQLKGKVKRTISQPLKTYLIQHGYKLGGESQICTKCRINAKSIVQSAPKDRSRCSIQLPFVSAGNSHNKCVFCNARKGIVVVPKEARTDAFIHFQLLIPVGCKCCRKHLIGKQLNRDVNVDFTKYKRQHSVLPSKELNDLLERVRFKALRSYDSSSLSFNKLSNDEDYISLLGISKANFDDLVTNVTSMRNTKIRTIRNAVGILLFKLKSGLSNGLLATLCGFRCRRQVAEIIESARIAIVKDFVPHNLGFDHITRESIIENHTTDISKQLFSDPISNTVILVLDGTYIYIQKSASYKFQRLSYSVHKGRPLVKPFLITTTSGYIVEVFGPYLANGRNNDASILKTVMKTNKGNIMDFLTENDVLVVDRGFRDSTDFLNECGFKTQMPVFLPKSCKQHSTIEANASRMVTKIRWVVEAANGRLKKWRFLDNVVSNSNIPSVGDFVRIVCSLINKYRPPLKTNDVNDFNNGFKMLMMSKNNENVLKELVTKDSNYRYRTNSKLWKSIDARDAAINFPALSEEDVRQLTFGTYQIRQANSYIREHIDETGQYAIDVSYVESDLIHCRIQSRHTSSTLYNLWIRFTISAVTSWYCQCKSGARTLGCCAHICSVIWYLGYHRHQCNKIEKDRYMSSVDDAGQYQTDNDDESE
ncbi:uncharacterized protein LOC133179753 [Saccostrea echinata]|uniref:uncharacterized protein LOC133179753 n=1 Tax=Saccostrea echinata TaxID=191078 RepID=UPI002A8116B5|nr:uncharacterized protein LOC133179753 [Saccostrea echinata]